MLTSEARHLVKIAALDSLEQIARQAVDPTGTAIVFEEVFEALDRRAPLAPGTVLDWGARYIAWAGSVAERNGLPFLTTGWASRLFEHAIAAGRNDLALAVTEAILSSNAPLEKERPWWQKQRLRLTIHPHT